MKRSSLIIFICILFLGVGFASVSTSLYINSDVGISSNISDFSVKFIDALIAEKNISISDDGDSFVFSLDNLTNIGDKSNLTFDIKNNSSMYDASVRVECGNNFSSSYNFTYDIVNKVDAKRSVTGNVLIEKISDVSSGDIFSCKLVSSPIERSEEAKAIYTGWVPKYYEFGTPSLTSTLKYSELNKSVFSGIDDYFDKGVCINDENLFCLKANDVNNSIRNLKEYFNSDKCFSNDDFFYCSSDSFTCTSFNDGGVGCINNKNSEACEVSSIGTFNCK